MPVSRLGVGHAVHPSPRQGTFGCEKTTVRQAPKIQRPSVQSCRSDDTRRYVEAGFGRKPSISCKISANNRRGTATSASWTVRHRPCRTKLAPILISFSRGEVRPDRAALMSLTGQSLPVRRARQPRPGLGAHRKDVAQSRTSAPESPKPGVDLTCGGQGRDRQM